MALRLTGRRVELRGLSPGDFADWSEVRTRCADWLLPWEPLPPSGHPDPVHDRRAFAARCGVRERERQLGSGYGFGIFVARRFIGEINVASVQRGPLQNATIGYWVDRDVAGNGYVPESAVVVFRYAFEELGLHRLEAGIIPRNSASRRVAEKLQMRQEGVAVRLLQINGVWEDHLRYAITAEEWLGRRQEYLSRWVWRSGSSVADHGG
ncbi:MAG: GNAT family N-acetyltransferase [Acidimicrobiales bacterium]